MRLKKLFRLVGQHLQYNFSNNPLTADGFTLGRTLFYDPLLSLNNTISCGSCHQQFAAFSHSGHDVSHGINGLLELEMLQHFKI